jgi:hypothetical protein
MYSITTARLGGRTRRVLLAAALSVGCAAFALPAAAEAATVAMNPATPGVLSYEAAPGETNQVFIRVDGTQLRISDNTAPITAGNGCALDAFGTARCPISVGSVILQLGDRNDRVEYAAPHQASIVGDSGNDLFLGGLRRPAPGRGIEPAFYFGGLGQDTISYQFADSGVRVDTDDERAEDGRPGIDRDDVDLGIETIEGSNFDDPQLFGSNGNDLLRGLNGDDVIGGGAGADIIDEGSAPNGADFLNGGDGPDDRVFYSTRTSGVNVSLDGVRNDGATGEQDDVRPSVEQIGGTNFADVLSGNSLANTIDGFGSLDSIIGGGGNDTLSAGAANNGIVAGTGNDVIEARNGQIDNIDCGENPGDSDTANRDADENRVLGCEDGEVGVLRLAPKAVAAQAGQTARLRLSWRHPVAWRKLDKVELRLVTKHGQAMGEVTIRPRGGPITADGAARLLRKQSRLARKGKTVSARLALRLDESLAGQALKVEVEATDRQKRRQLERNAGTVRVAG